MNQIENGKRVTVRNSEKGIVRGKESKFKFYNGKAHYIVELEDGMFHIFPDDEVTELREWEDVDDYRIVYTSGVIALANGGQLPVNRGRFTNPDIKIQRRINYED